MTITIAIIGSGPAGFYTASALLKTVPDPKHPDIEIDVIDRLPTPFGLIRAGVAPDHQTTKKVAKSFEKTALRDEVRYFGHVEVGRDITLDYLREIYDVVVIATGAALDRNTNMAGRDKVGVFGASAFVGWYNGHPDWTQLNPDLDVEKVAVIGNGNVALDVARLLVETDDELAKTDIASYAKKAISNANIKEVTIFGRRGALEAKFSNVELRELIDLEAAITRVKRDQLPADLPDMGNDRDARLARRNLDTLRTFSASARPAKPKEIKFEFFAQPVEILGDEVVRGLRLERTCLSDGRAQGTGEFFDYDCGLVVSAIGYRSEELAGAPYDSEKGVIENDDGRIAKGFYVVGWAKRGPSGVISSNKPDGEICARQIREDIKEGQKLGRLSLQHELARLGRDRVSYRDWVKIDQAEIDAAKGPAPREKFIAVEDMLSVLDDVENRWALMTALAAKEKDNG